jgi:hypothetical protein
LLAPAPRCRARAMSAGSGPPADSDASELDMFSGLQRRLRRRHWLGDLWLSCGRKRAMLLGGARGPRARRQPPLHASSLSTAPPRRAPLTLSFPLLLSFAVPSGHVAVGEALTCLCRCTECAAGYAAGRDVSLTLPAFFQHASLPVAVSDEEADATWRTALRVAGNVEMRGQARAHAGGGLCCSSSGSDGAEFRWLCLKLTLPPTPMRAGAVRRVRARRGGRRLRSVWRRPGGPATVGVLGGRAQPRQRRRRAGCAGASLCGSFSSVCAASS